MSLWLCLQVPTVHHSVWLCPSIMHKCRKRAKHTLSWVRLSRYKPLVNVEKLHPPSCGKEHMRRKKPCNPQGGRRWCAESPYGTACGCVSPPSSVSPVHCVQCACLSLAAAEDLQEAQPPSLDSGLSKNPVGKRAEDCQPHYMKV